MSNSKEKEIAPTELSFPQLENRHRNLVAELADIGLVLRGNIGHHLNRCGNPTCRCKADPPMLHGPYYRWTRKVEAKTVSVTLTPEQATRCMIWSENMRRMDQIVGQLQEIGLQAAALLCSSDASRRATLGGPEARKIRKP